MAKKKTYEELENMVDELKREVNNLQIANKKLVEDEEEWRSLLKNAPDIILKIDQHGKILFINRTVPGFTVEKTIGKSVYDYIPPEYHDLTRKSMNLVFKTGDVISFDSIACGPNRTTSWYSTRLGPIKRGDKTVAVTQISTDITERKRSEHMLRIRDWALRSSINGIAFADLQGNLTYVNDSFLKMWGYNNQKEVLGKPAVTFWKVRKKASEVLEELRNSGGWEDELVAVKKDGSLFDVHFSASMVKDENGIPMCMMGSFIDITKSKQASRSLKEKEQELKIKNTNLEEVNTALKVLIKRIEEDKMELEEKILSNVKELVVPYLEKLKKSILKEKQKIIVNVLESNVNDIISPFSHRLSYRYLDFTPAEIQIANLVKLGKTTKEISDMLILSLNTIEHHRKSIRSKLGIKKKKANLRAHLLSLQ